MWRSWSEALLARHGPTGDGSAVSDLPNCPKCDSVYSSVDRDVLTCPECGHTWSTAEAAHESETKVVRDANGNELQDGDTVTVIKDLKVRGSSSVVKVGTKVRNIRLVEGDHDIDCKIDGIGPMSLKSGFVRKVT